MGVEAIKKNESKELQFSKTTIIQPDSDIFLIDDNGANIEVRMKTIMRFGAGQKVKITAKAAEVNINIVEVE